MTTATQNEPMHSPSRPTRALLNALLIGAIVFVAALGAHLAAPAVERMVYGDSATALEESGSSGEAGEPATAQDLTRLAPPIYLPLDPALVVSLAAEDGSTHFLQLTVQAMARSQKAIDAIRTHAPALRNGFLFLIATHTFEDMTTLAGKEALRAQMRDEARNFLLRNTGDSSLEELYFTSFVVQ